MKKQYIIALVLSVLSLVFMSDFHFFSTVFFMPNILWLVPFYLFFLGSIFYVIASFKADKKLGVKIGIMLVNGILIYGLFYIGFHIWKLNTGNIFSETVEPFQINLKNIWFWCVYQSYLILLLLSAFKQLVTIA